MRNSHSRMAKIIIAVLFFLGLSMQTQAVETKAWVKVNSGLEYELIATYDQKKLDQILGVELDSFMSSSTQPDTYRNKFVPAKFAVNLYRVRYRSVIPELNNQPTIASGLLAIPVTESKTLPLVSYQHGTVFNKNFVPSRPDQSMETRIMLAVFAAQGYVVVGADYFGRGLSDLPDSYLVKDSTRQATFDMLWSAKDILDSMQLKINHFFMSGWSQGGWVTMQFLKKLDIVGVSVTAVAAASAPVDIYLTMNRWVNNYQPVDAVYLPGVVALQLQAQEFYMKQVGLLESAVKPQFLQASRDLYQGKIDWESFFKLTPAKLQDYLRPEFANSGLLGDSPYWQVLDNNQAYRWKSEVPLRTYYGGRDEVTPKVIGQLPEATQKLLGGASASSVYAGDQADHRGVFLYGVIDQKKWFDTFLSKNM